jgi:V/A-type H+/Na+-transporting ATPase subunit I
VLVAMAKVEIIGPRSLLADVIGVLHQEGRVHIEDLSRRIEAGDMPLDNMVIQGDDVARHEGLREQLVAVRGILAMLPALDVPLGEEARTQEYQRLWALAPEASAEQIASLIERTRAEVGVAAERRAAIETESSLLAHYEPMLAKIQPIAADLVVTGQFDSIALLIDRRYKDALEHLHDELNEATDSRCECVSQEIDDHTVAAIVVFPRTVGDKVRSLLATENVNQIRLPDEFRDVPFDAAYRDLHERREALPAQLVEVRQHLAELSLEWRARLEATRDVLSDRIDEIVAIPQFGQTERVFLIDGWVPIEDVEALGADFERRFGGGVVVLELAASADEIASAPIALNNPGWVEPYEKLVGFVGTPKYGTYDPTWMLAIFYPLFFGMIVGDVGYGAVMLATIFAIRVRFKDNVGVRLATSILAPAAASAVAFGFVYGEFFGNLLGKNLGGLLAPVYARGWSLSLQTAPSAVQVLPFDRTQSDMLVPAMLIALAIGFAQVLLGLGLGIYNAVVTKNRANLYEKSGIMAFVVGFVALVLGVIFAEVLRGSALWIQAAAALLLLLGLVFAVRGGQVIGAVESISALANIASYIRIMAIGLAGAIFANAANGIAAKMGNPVLGILVAAPLQALNFAIAAFTPNIHALRLNFLEFFGKFYETGNKPYRPFHKSGGER